MAAASWQKSSPVFEVVHEVRTALAAGTSSAQDERGIELNTSICEIERWIKYAESLPWQPGQLDETSYLAFLRAASLGVPANEAFQAILDRLRGSGVPLRLRKVECQLRRAYAYAGAKASFERATANTGALNTWPARDQALVKRIAADGPGLYDLWESSPVRFDDGQSHTEDLVDALFPGNPLLCVGQSSYKFWTASREPFRGRLDKLQFIVSSPMTALTGRTKEGRESGHTLENTGPRRFLVIEFDSGSLDQQAALLYYLARRGPLVTVLHSGGKSLHGWFYCRSVPDNLLRRFMNCAHRLGADKATWLNRSQFVRMPDGIRSNGNRQSVYYFNPELCAK
jgi:hypothetical protein